MFRGSIRKQKWSRFSIFTHKPRFQPACQATSSSPGGGKGVRVVLLMDTLIIGQEEPRIEPATHCVAMVPDLLPRGILSTHNFGITWRKLLYRIQNGLYNKHVIQQFNVCMCVFVCVLVCVSVLVVLRLCVYLPLGSSRVLMLAPKPT